MAKRRNPTPEEKRFHAAVARARAQIRKLASGAGDLSVAIRAVDKAQDLERWVEEADRELARELRGQLRAADDAGRAVRIAENEAEIARLTREMRDRQPIGFEKEIALMRGRRNPAPKGNPYQAEQMIGGVRLNWHHVRTMAEARKIAKHLAAFNGLPVQILRLDKYGRRTPVRLVRPNPKAKRPKQDPRQIGLRLPARPGEIDRRELLETAIAQQLVLPVRPAPSPRFPGEITFQDIINAQRRNPRKRKARPKKANPDRRAFLAQHHLALAKQLQKRASDLADDWENDHDGPPPLKLRRTVQELQRQSALHFRQFQNFLRG